MGPLHAPGADGFAVVVQGDVAALGQAAAVVGECHAHLMLSGGEGLLGSDRIKLNAQEVVAVIELALVGIHAPAADAAALVDDHPGRAGLRHRDVGGYGV